MCKVSGAVSAATLLAGIVLSLHAHATGKPDEIAAAVEELSQLMLQDLVVTAQKRAEPLHDIPLAVSAFDASTVHEKALADVEDLNGQAPNLFVSSLWASSDPKIFMRGVGNNNFNQTAESKIALYLDQVYIGAPSGQMFPLFDVERIEVLRGPQGSLYGKNAAGGAIAVSSLLPQPGLGGYLHAGVGNLSGRVIESALNAPFGDELLSRTSFVLRQREGHVRDAGTGARVNDTGTWAARTLWSYKPSAQASLLLNLRGGRSDSTHNNSAHRGLFDPGALADGDLVRLPSAAVIAGQGVDILGYADPDPDPYVNTYGDATFARIDLFGGSLLAEIGLPGGHTLTSVTGYEQSRRHVLQDGNGAPSTIFSIDWGPSTFKQWSQEWRITSPETARLRWLAGVFLLDERGRVNNFYGMTSVNSLLGVEAFDQMYEQDTRDYALFGQVTWPLAARWRVTVGARASRENRELDHVTFTSDEDGGNPAPLVDVDLERSWNEASGRIALDYRPSADQMYFLSVNRGFTTGGFNTGAFNYPEGAAQIFDPEQVISYELGLKSTWRQHRLRFNATAFLYTYTDLQVFVFTSAAQQSIVNASDAHVSGLELELQAVPLANLELGANLGLLNAEYHDFVRGTENLSGNRMIGAPRWQANLSAQYRYPLSYGALVGRADLTFLGQRYYDERQRDDISSEGGSRNLDAKLKWVHPREKLAIALWGRNLTDEVDIIDVVDVELFGYQNVWYNTPRTWGVSFELDF